MKIIKFFVPVLLLLLASFAAQTQHKYVAKMVQEKFAGAVLQSPVTDLLQENRTRKDARADKTFRKYSMFSLNQEVVSKLIQTQPELLSLQIENDDAETWILDLVNAGEPFRETIITTATGNKYPFSKFRAAYYRGVVRGQEESTLATISLFDDEISVLVSTSQGNIIIGKIRGSSNHIVYNSKNQLIKGTFHCGTANLPLTDAEKNIYASIQNTETARTLLDRCVRLYYETEYDILQREGSMAGVVNSVTALFNQVSILYLNEGIKMLLSQIMVWDVEDPYTGFDTEETLTQFQAERLSFNGDLAQLVNYRTTTGGQAASFNGLCGSPIKNRLSVADILHVTSIFPEYNSAVFISTHEFGHLMGSHHTHGCVWNGNNTAIDGCAGSTEGGCPLPGIPAAGGTIMSYCFALETGVDFNLGFGPQPGNVIRAGVNGAACLAICCKTNISISGNYTKPLTESGTWIASSGTTTILPGDIIKLDAAPATGYVLLTPGFSTSANTVFVAQAFNGCTVGAPAKTANGEFVPEIAQAVVPFSPAHAGVFLHPNPATGIIHIHTVSPGEQVKRITIANTSGKIMLTCSNKRMLDIAKLRNGLYICTVETSSGVFSGKLVKQ